MIYHLIIMTLGLLSSLILFSKFPVLKKERSLKLENSISIIIPARNEEKNLKLLLDDLKSQTLPIHEIICVDDGSTDKSYDVAMSYGVQVIEIKEKPSDWAGKAWACQKGANMATGDLYVFLDADVRLSHSAIAKLYQAYKDEQCTVSVQPYHRTKKFYEQFSFFFNLIQIAANGTSLKFKTKGVGLYGPVILMDEECYWSIDGHLSAQKSIVDDVALGEKLTQMGLNFKLFMGGKDISFRMYGDKLRSLYQGWVKNYGTGAIKTPKSTLSLISLWMASAITSSVMIILLLFTDLYGSFSFLIIAIYLCWVLEFLRIGAKAGKFKLTTPILFPIYLLFFTITFMISMYKKTFQKNVVWKERSIKLD